MELLFEYSKENIELLQAEDLILQKNALMEKLEEQLLLLGKGKAKSNIKLSAISPPLKVSKGEKHEGLPFLVLDYPRIFGQEDIFAIRYLVWWENKSASPYYSKGVF